MGHDHHHHHDHGHGHAHAHGVRALQGALLLNGGFLLIEAGVGWWSGSLALLSDAAHMAGDVAALVLALAAARLGEATASVGRSFGLRRAEVLGAFVNGLLLLGAVAWILVEAASRIGAGPPDVPGVPVLIVGLVGLAINLGSAWMLHRAGSENLNVRGALVHMLADALGSVGAIAAAALVIAGHPIADPVISVGIAALVAVGTWGLLRDATRVLLQLPPAGLDLDALVAGLVAVPGVAAVHDVHIWSVDGRRAIVTAHVVLDGTCSPEDALAAALAAVERAAPGSHATLQLERTPGCGLEHCVPISAAARAG